MIRVFLRIFAEFFVQWASKLKKSILTEKISSKKLRSIPTYGIRRCRNTATVVVLWIHGHRLAWPTVSPVIFLPHFNFSWRNISNWDLIIWEKVRKFIFFTVIIPGDEAKKQWQRLREGYSKNKNQKKPSGSAAGPRAVKWEYFNLMDSFLAPFVKPRKYSNEI